MEEDHKFEFLVILDYKVRLSLKQNNPPPQFWFYKDWMLSVELCVPQGLGVQ